MLIRFQRSAHVFFAVVVEKPQKKIKHVCLKRSATCTGSGIEFSLRTSDSARRCDCAFESLKRPHRRRGLIVGFDTNGVKCYSLQSILKGANAPV
jgi:hypothetical protein